MESKEKTNPTTESKAQSESKYDSHSEEKPHQETTVDTDSNPDRVSHDNTANYLEKLPVEIEKVKNSEEEDNEEEEEEKILKREWDASFYPITKNFFFQ